MFERPRLCRRLDAEPLALLVEDVFGDRLRGPLAAVMLAVARRRARVVAAVPVRDSIVVREWIAVHVDRGIGALVVGPPMPGIARRAQRAVGALLIGRADQETDPLARILPRDEARNRRLDLVGHVGLGAFEIGRA